MAASKKDKKTFEVKCPKCGEVRSILQAQKLKIDRHLCSGVCRHCTQKSFQERRLNAVKEFIERNIDLQEKK